MSKTCPNCRAAVPDDSVFCPNCGKRMAPQQTHSQPYVMNGQPYNQPNSINNYPNMMNDRHYTAAGGKNTVKTINIVLAVIAVIQLIVICFVRPGWLRQDNGKNAEKSAASVSVMLVSKGSDRNE